MAPRSPWVTSAAGFTSSGLKAFSRRQERPRIVAEDSLHALAPQPERVRGVVHGPDMDHGAAVAQRARQGRDGNRDAVPARRDAERLKERGSDAAPQERRKHQTDDIGRARTEREAGAAKRARRGGIEARDDDALRDAVPAYGDPQALGRRG